MNIIHDYRKTQEQTSTSSTEALNTRKMTKWSIHDVRKDEICLINLFFVIKL